MRILPCLLPLALLVTGCAGDAPSGDDDGAGTPDAGVQPGDRHDVPAKLIAGGGVSDAPIAQVLHVYVIDERSGAGISGATVRAGTLSATTDAAGLASFDDTALLGKQTVSAGAAGHAAATWIGVLGANVTIPLRPSGAPPSAKASGSFVLPDRPQGAGLGDYVLGVVLSTFTPDIAAPDNQLPQAMDGGSPRNIMVRTAVGNDGNWELTTRTGKQRLYVVVMNGNTQDTNSDPSDDTLVINSYAVSSAVDAAAGQSLSPALTPVAGALTTFSATFPASIGSLTDVVAFPVLDLGADGKLVIPVPPLKPGSASTKVPPATGALSGSYGAAALATPAGDLDMPFSSSTLKNVSGTAALPAWLAPPTGLSAKKSGSASFTASAGAAVSFVAFLAADKTPVWTVMVLDGSTSVAASGLAPEPAAGATTAQVTCAEVPGFDPEQFTVSGLSAATTRAAGDRVNAAP